MSPEIEKAIEHFSKIKTLPLTNHDGFFIIDAEDYERLSKRKWHKRINSIVATTTHTPLSNCVLGITGIVDHIDRNFIDNRKKNLRKASKSQNGCNKAPQKNNTSGVPGVVYFKRDNKWYARIQKARITYNLGSFKTKEEAIKARNEGARKYHGEFAVIYPI